MKIALGQLGAGPVKQQNLERIGSVAAEAAGRGADLTLFPEAVMVGVEPSVSLAPFAEPLDGPFVAALQRLAARHRMVIVAGVFEPAGKDRVFNTVVAVAGDGTTIGSYRKMHLYDAFGYRESDRIASGDGRTLVFEHEGLRLGAMTCYEVRFPEVARRLAQQGADVVLLPAAWVRGPLKEMHWETLARARAIENTVYVAAAGQVSANLAGLSAIYDPMGVAIVSAGEVEGCVVGDVSHERLEEVRRLNPSMSLRRPEIYSGWELAKTRS
jgi:deaminated glutathione amidase